MPAADEQQLLPRILTDCDPNAPGQRNTVAKLWSETDLLEVQSLASVEAMCRLSTVADLLQHRNRKRCPRCDIRLLASPVCWPSVRWCLLAGCNRRSDSRTRTDPIWQAAAGAVAKDFMERAKEMKMYADQEFGLVTVTVAAFRSDSNRTMLKHAHP